VSEAKKPTVSVALATFDGARFLREQLDSDNVLATARRIAVGVPAHRTTPDPAAAPTLGSLTSEPLVTVLTPARNAERYIEETIQSLRSQSYPRIEHIVLSSGSTDRTEEIAAAHAPFVRLVTDPLQGQAEKFNRGLELARGEIIGWLSADDLYLPGATSHAVAELTADSSLAMVYADYVEIDERGERLRELHCVEFDLDVQLNVRNLVSQPTVFMRTEALRALGGLDTSYRHAQDYELWIRMGERYRIRHVPEYWAAYRRHPQQESVLDVERIGKEIRHASRAHGGRMLSEIGYSHVRWMRVARMVRRGEWSRLLDGARHRLLRTPPAPEGRAPAVGTEAARPGCPAPRPPYATANHTDESNSTH
jgi:GT2 family glycosyltransferase